LLRKRVVGAGLAQGAPRTVVDPLRKVLDAARGAARSEGEAMAPVAGSITVPTGCMPRTADSVFEVGGSLPVAFFRSKIKRLPAQVQVVKQVTPRR